MAYKEYSSYKYSMDREKFGSYEGCPNCMHAKLVMQFYYNLWLKVTTTQNSLDIITLSSTKQLELPKDVQRSEASLRKKSKFKCLKCKSEKETIEWYKYFLINYKNFEFEVSTTKTRKILLTSSHYRLFSSIVKFKY